MLNLILFGPPGSGKGTQAIKLVEKYKLLHISTGDLFRFEMDNKTPLGLKAKEYMNQGQLVPDEVTIGMLKNKVLANLGASGFIFDGFPRTIAQSQALDDFLAENNESITALISLVVDEKEIVKRLLERGKTSGRADDKDEQTIRKRYAVYLDETSPVYGYYGLKNKSIQLPGIGSKGEIFDSICNEINKHL